MARKRYKPEEIFCLLRQAEVLHGQGMSMRTRSGTWGSGTGPGWSGCWCRIRAARAAIGARTGTSSPRRSPVSIPTGAAGSPPATVCAPIPSQHAGPPPSEGRIAGRWLPASPRPPTPRGRFVPGREKPVERATGTRGGAHSPIHPSSGARDAVPPEPSNHAGVPPRRPRATVRRAGRRRDSVESGAGSRARPGAAFRCRRIRR